MNMENEKWKIKETHVKCVEIEKNPHTLIWIFFKQTNICNVIEYKQIVFKFYVNTVSDSIAWR